MFDDIRDKVIEALQTAKAQVEESDAYNQLKERFDSLSPLVQKTLLGTVAFLLLYLVAQFPLSYYRTSSDNLALYEENRDIILDLYRIKRKANSVPQTPPPLEALDLENRARSAVTGARIQPEQLKSIMPFDNTTRAASGFIPKSVTQAGVEVRLANLNLTQIVDIGNALSNLGNSAKMVGLEVKPGTETGNYFDAVFQIVSFNIPSSAPAGGK
ncbi:MAG: hypothetical protein RBT63_03545 [Bdellovibrionales bacterium]|jgi:hypothetical protein|nr:hypothetical protein [Bdellovibrionales bacterium]